MTSRWRCFEQTIATARSKGVSNSVTRAQHSIAETLFAIGRFSEGHALLERTKEEYLRQDRQGDLLLLEMEAAKGWLNMRQLKKASKQLDPLITTFKERKEFDSEADAILLRAMIYLAEGELDDAKASLQDLRSRLTDDQVLLKHKIYLAEAQIYLFRQNWQKCYEFALECQYHFRQNSHTVYELEALLLLAKCELELSWAIDRSRTTRLLDLSDQLGLPQLSWQVHAVMAAMAERSGDFVAAGIHYEEAIGALESIVQEMITEFRADFLLDKNEPYERLAQIYLMDQQIEKALLTAERAKSRALFSLLSQPVSTSPRPLDPEHQSILDTNKLLQAQALRRYRSLMFTANKSDVTQKRHHEELLRLEEEMSANWYRLLSINQGYYKYAASMQRRTSNNKDELWHSVLKPAISTLDSKTLIVEYFANDGDFIAFLVSADSITVQTLPGTTSELVDLLAFWQLELRKSINRLIRGISPQELPLIGAQKILKRAYDLLFEPIFCGLRTLFDHNLCATQCTSSFTLSCII